MSALAIAILCFCPPLNIAYSLSKPISLTKLHACACFKMVIISSSSKPSAIKAYLIVLPINTGSCPTYPMQVLRLSKVKLFKSCYFPEL